MFYRVEGGTGVPSCRFIECTTPIVALLSVIQKHSGADRPWFLSRFLRLRCGLRCRGLGDLPLVEAVW